jgi:hypothetical protein
MIAALIVGLFLFIALCFSVYINFKLSKLIFSLEDQVEESLDILDENYQLLATAASHPVMSDEPVIKQVMADIKSARDAVLLIANKLVTFGQTKTKETDV